MNLIVDILRAAIPAGTPLLLGTLGEIYVERSGILNLGVEGIMIMGAVTAFGVTTLTSNVWLGIFASTITGGMMALIHAFDCVTLKANQTLSGLALTMLGSGLSGLIGKRYIGMPLSSKLQNVPLKGLVNIPVIGPVLFDQDPLVYISYILAFLFWFFLFNTRFGITLRSVGESPEVADSAGINIPAIQYFAVFLGGIMSGLGGAYLSVAYAPVWIEGMTAGTGWIVLAITIFSLWRPERAILGSYLFGGVRVLQYRLQPLGISPNILNMMPFVFTILVLMIASREISKKRIGAPASLGVSYQREKTL
ncbi:MAG: ABC transporter permease [Dictyoglomi bacterium]|jgi:simple sugar transport system permease protein|nr:ABC transporter permease [Dictyoglomota bacterium]HHV81562.1 ABC transporter permease [bacterium]